MVGNMKAITLWQPWASLLARGAKQYETRSWEAPHRGPIAIHAAKKPFNTDSYLDRELYPFAAALGLPDIFSFDTLPYGRIIAVAELIECWRITDRYYTVGAKVEEARCIKAGGKSRSIDGDEILFGDWTPGRYAWELEKVHQLTEPIPAKGMQRIWNWDETPHLVSIDPYAIGDTKIWTPQGVRDGKKNAGRLLDGQEYSEFPEARP